MNHFLTSPHLLFFFFATPPAAHNQHHTTPPHHNRDALLGLTAEKLLTEFEVKSLGHRKKILFRIRDLKRA
jgi:hypothetical protein